MDQKKMRINKMRDDILIKDSAPQSYFQKFSTQIAFLRNALLHQHNIFNTHQQKNEHHSG